MQSFAEDLVDGFAVGDCRVEPRELRVCRDGVWLRLEPRIMQVLLALARRRGSTVSRDELLAEAWSGLVVSDDAIHRAIYRLRAALSDDPRTDPVIETVAKVGYRLVKPVATAWSDALEKALECESLATPPPRRGLSRLGAAFVGLATIGAAVLIVRPPEGVPDDGIDTAPEWSTVTLNPALEHMPTFSPDGSQLVFGRSDNQGKEHLWLYPLAGTPATQLTVSDGMDYAADWSAAGERIAFIRQDARRCRLMLMSVLAPEPREVAECTPANGRLALSPDGRTLVWSDRPRPDQRANALFLLDVESGARRELPPPPGEHGDYRPRWSPDGEWIAYTRVEGRYQSSIYRMRPDGTDISRVWSPSGYVHQLDWLGNDALIATRRDAAITELWHVPLQGEATRITEIEDGLPSIDVSPDRRSLALSLLVAEHRNLRVDALEQDATPRTSTMPEVTQQSRELAVSPDGALLAMEFESRGESSLWLSDLSGGQVRRLWRESGAYIRDLSWDHAGRRVAFERSRNGQQTICVSNLDGVTHCFEGTQKRLSPSWSHDDEHLYYTLESQGRWFVHRARCDGSEEQRVSERQAVYALESNSGDALYLRLRGVDGVLEIDRRSGKERTLAPDATQLRPRAFVAAQSGLYYLRADGALMHLPKDEAPARELFRLSGKLPRTLSLPASEDFLLYTKIVEEKSDIGLLTNLDQVLASNERVKAPALVED